MWQFTSIRSLLDPYKAGVRPGETVLSSAQGDFWTASRGDALGLPPLIHPPTTFYNDYSSIVEDVTGVGRLQHRQRIES